GADVTKPAPAGSTNEPASLANDQITIYDCRTRTSLFSFALGILYREDMGDLATKFNRAAACHDCDLWILTVSGT
ncbi:hypothetical protein, partial [Nonomuraea cavernae]|uniref:hypothetical protein n=1 Tax=Nonomuraea cavernae TaxID=2045107 RepID=UPI0034004FB5